MGAAERGARPPRDARRLRVLVADDDPDVRFLLKSWLEVHGGFEVVDDVADGLAAVEAAQRTRPEAVVLDLAMPRMDGLEATSTLRRLLPDVRIIIQSAFSTSRMAQKAIDAGADVYLQKTADRDVLYSTIESLFADRPLDVGRASEEPPVSETTRVSRTEDLVTAAEDRFDLLLATVTVPAAVLRPETSGGGTVTGFRVEQVNAPGRRHTGWHVGARVDVPDELPDPAVAAERLHEHLALAVGLDAVQVQRTRSGEVLVVWGPTETPAEPTELLEAAVISNPVGAALFDSSGRLVMANSVADQLLGGTRLLRASPVTRPVCTADTREPVAEEDLPLARASRGEHVESMGLFIADVEGSGIYVKVSAHPVFGAHGEPAGAVVSVLDDTPAKRAELELAATHQELERSNRELEEFAYTASHDLAQPLQSIYGFAQLLQDEGLGDAHAEDHLNRIVAGCERMQTLIEDLLAYSRVTIDAAPFEPVELGAVADDVLEVLETGVEAAGARVTVAQLPRVKADRTQMHQLFQNLVGNALKYVAAGVSPDVQVSSSHRDHEWLIVVTDNGIGIPAADRERAFAMFERLETSADYPGTGIGLAVCAKIVERHGGRIWVEDNPRGGSRFCFTLPDAG